MSRSYKKFAKESVDNEFFKLKSRNTRHKNRNKLRTLLAQEDLEDFADNIYIIKNNIKFSDDKKPTSNIIWKDSDLKIKILRK